jgi:hypothetical protein
MTQLETKLLQALRQLEETVRTRGPELGMQLQHVDELATELPKGTSPDLLHYLHKKSYQKARLWLEGRDAENEAGQCPRTV